MSTPDPGVPQSGTKAIVAGIAAGLIAGLSTLIPALNSDSPNGSSLSGQEAAQVALAFVIGTGVVGGATYRVPNKRK